MNERATAQVFLDGKQAEGVIDMLKSKANQLKQAIVEAGQAGDHVTMKKLQSELKGVESSMRLVKKETFDVQKVLDNLSGASINDLNKALNKTNAEMKRMGRLDPGYGALKSQAKLLKTELNGINNEMKVQTSWFSRAGDSFNRYFGIITAGAATFAGLILAGKKSVEVFNQFEERVDNLSALTGLVDEPLKELQNLAKATSIATIETSEGNIKIKQSADAIVDAYTVVGSKRPELLKNSEALHAVTTDAIILSEAAKTKLEPAVLGLTMAMNQLGLGADQSRRIINVMAAGSKEGSGEIPYLTDAYEKCGTSARMLGISVEQLTGTIEAVAPSYSEAVVAGTSFDRVLLKMKANNIGYVNGQFDLIAGIDELEKRYKSGQSAVDIFGIEQAKMGELLVLNKNDIIKYTAAVTGTQVALEQASKNTNNNAAKLAQAQNKAQLYRIELGEKLSPVMTNFTSTGAIMLKILSAMVTLFSKHGTEILLVAGAIAFYTITLKINTAETKANLFWTKSASSAQAAWGTITGLLTGKIKLATVAQRIWNNTVKANPLGAAAAVAMILIGAIVLLVKKMNEQTAVQRAVNEVQKEAKKSIIEQKLKIEDLLKVAKDEKKSLEDRKAALAELNKISPEYFGNLSIEKSKTEDLTKAGNDYLASLEKIALVKAAQDKIDQLRKDHANAEIDQTDSKVKWYQTLLNVIKSQGNVAVLAGNQVVTAAKNETKAQKDYNDQLKAMQDIIDKNSGKKLSDTTTTTTTTVDPKPPVLTPEEIKALSDDANKALDIAHAQEMLRLKQYYSDKEELDKEFKARLLASELAYLMAKEKLEPDELKKIELQSQIIDKQNEYTAALKAAAPQLLITRDGTKKLNDQLLEEAKLLKLAADKQDDATNAMNKMAAKTQSQATLITDTALALSDSIYELASGGEDALEMFAKSMIMFALDQLKLQTEIAIAGVTIQGLASLNPAGMVVAALKVAAIEVVFAGLKGLVNSAFDSKGKAAGGYANPGGKYDPDGIYHKGEFINAQESVNNPTIKPVLNIIDFAQKNGTAASINLPAAMASKGLLPGKGKSSGGYASTGSATGSSTSSETTATGSGASNAISNKELTQAVNKLNEILGKGIKAQINKFGTNSLSEGLNDISKFNEKIGRK